MGDKTAWTKKNPERARLLWRRGHQKNKEYRNAQRRLRWQRQVAEDPLRLHEQKVASLLRLKAQVLTYYGGGKYACVTCQVADPDVLTIDHIAENGADERRGAPLGSLTGYRYYARLRRAGYPSGYQTLCANCNLKKARLHRRAMALQRAKAKETAL